MPDEVKVESQEADEDKDELESALEGSKEEGDKNVDVKDEDKDKEEKTGEDKEDGDKDKEKEEEPDPVELLRDEVKDLRQMLRTSKRELTQTQAKLERVGKRPAASSTEDDEEDEEDKEKKDKEESLTSVEELQGAIAHIGATRGPALDILLETMEQNEKYKDIRDVCSRGNFDDIFEVIAQDATKAGGDFDEALLEVELNVWSKSNPYRYMYDLIKKYHPAYTKEAKGDGDKDKDKKTPAKAPGTIVDKGGDSNLKSGWTAKRIDDLSEDELDQVPQDVYKKYMLGNLD